VEKEVTVFSGFFLRWRRALSSYGFTLLEILASRLTIFEQLLTRWRISAFSQEIQLLNVTPHEKVLHIGCGAFPSASLLIARNGSAHVTGIDNNQIAVRLAQSYINKKHLSCQITIEYGNGATYPLQDFDAIFIAINVWPIDRVLSHLAETMKPTARILCKGSHQDILILLKKKEFQQSFSIASQLQHPKTEAFLLTKKK